MQLALYHVIDAQDQVGKTGVTFEESRTIKFVTQVDIYDLCIIEHTLINVEGWSYVWSQVAQVAFDLDMDLGI